MTHGMLALASRAVACPKWRWMPGMCWLTEDDLGRLDDYQPEYMVRPPGALPDLTDPATVGCIVALLREARKEPYGCVCVVTPEPSLRFACAWVSGLPVAQVFRLASTEVEALVLALEHTP